MKSSPKIAVGSTVWRFDINHRIYPENKDMCGAPIYRKHFIPEKITGETSRSWITERGNKIPKKAERTYPYFLTKQDVEDIVWIHDHRFKLVERLRGCKDVVLLRKTAELLDYRDEV